MNEEAPQFNTDAQRRALDVMSARLLDNLNTMIAEQEARVQEFSRQQNSLSPLPTEEMTPVLPPTQQPSPAQNKRAAVKTWEPSPAAPDAPPPVRRSVTPPPVKSKKLPQPHYNVPKPPLPKGTAAMDGDEKKEASFGCGSLSVAIVVIIILLRACS